MEILLFNTPICMKELRPEKFVTKKRFLEFLIGERGVFGREPPNGIMYLSAILKQKGYKTYVKDGFFTQKKDIIDFMKNHHIDVLGISCVSYNWKKAKAILREVKTMFPRTVTVVGGPHPNAIKEQCLKESEYIDVVVYGDGEYTLTEVLDRLKNKRSLKGLKGTAIREGRKIIKNPPRPFIKNLDKLPFPDRDCIDIKKYQPSAVFHKKLPWTAMFGTRGCPNRCRFCNTTKQVAFRTPQNVVDEMEYVIKKYGIKDITFYDENFVLNRRWVIDLCNDILRRKLNILWNANARVDSIDEELLRIMKKAGCWRLLCGLESGVQKNLDLMKKDIKIEDAKKAIKLTKKIGIESYGIFIFGFPGETYEEAIKTIDFACDLGLDYVAFNTIRTYPGTQLYEEIKDTPGLIGIEKTSDAYVSYISPQMTEAKLKKLVMLGYKKFYLRPSYILWRITKLRSWEDIKRHLQGFLLMISS